MAAEQPKGIARDVVLALVSLLQAFLLFVAVQIMARFDRIEEHQRGAAAEIGEIKRSLGSLEANNSTNRERINSLERRVER